MMAGVTVNVVALVLTGVLALPEPLHKRSEQSAARATESPVLCQNSMHLDPAEFSVFLVVPRPLSVKTRSVGK
jgi:hypothetical protein